MWRGVRNCPVLSGGSDLAEHVLVDVALGVAFRHRYLVEQVYHLGEQRRGRDGEASVLHVLRVGGVGAPDLPGQVVAQIGKDVLPDHREHLGRREVPEARPAAILVGTTLVILAFREDPPLHRLLEPVGLVFLQRVHVVEPADEQQVGNLLHHLQRVRDAAGPKCVPDAVDLGLDVACDHLRGFQIGPASFAGLELVGRFFRRLDLRYGLINRVGLVVQPGDRQVLDVSNNPVVQKRFKTIENALAA